MATTDAFASLSTALAACVGGAAHRAVALATADGQQRSGILWRGGVIVASDQSLPDQPAFTARLADGISGAAQIAGRDPGTNIVVLRLEGGPPAEPPAPASGPAVGALAVALGRGAAGITARLAMLHAVGPAWQSMAGGQIDALLRLDLRLGRAEDGGPVVDAAGGLLGMATAGPRGRGLVIPYATIARVVEPLLAHGGMARGWLGVGLQPVALPEGLRAAAAADSGLMVVSLAADGPADKAGVLPGDILLLIDGAPVGRPRHVAALLGPERIGQALPVRLMRAGAVLDVAITVAARPPA